MKVIYDTVACKFCGSLKVVKYGKYHGIQRFLCRTCGRKFADNDALPNMHTPSSQVVSALNAYYEGMSLAAIQRQVEVETGNKPSDSTVYRWIQRFSRKAVNETKDIKPNVGNVWVADETVIDVGGKKIWFWDIIDTKTRFLLASETSMSRTKKAAETLMNRAKERAGKSPKYVITDKLAAYSDGVELAFGADTQHKQGGPFNSEVSREPTSNAIERFHGTLKARTKVMRGLKKRDTVILEGWLVHYNYFRPHESLRDRTPAEVAGVKAPVTSWKDVVAPARPNKTSVTDVATSMPPRPVKAHFETTKPIFAPTPKLVEARIPIRDDTKTVLKMLKRKGFI